MPTLHLRGLSKLYPNGTVGLHPCDLAVTSGECLVLTGPSGAGKSTLLRLVAGLEIPSAGTISVDGREIQALPPHERQVAYLAQEPALFPHLNVRENLAVGREFEERRRPRTQRLGAAALRKIVEETAETLEIAGLLERRTSELSGGEKQRVALGRALARGVGLWLLDEPLGKLDWPLREKLCRVLHLLNRSRNLTIVFVTHDPLEAKALADRLGVLEAGRLGGVKPPDQALVASGQPSVFFRF